MRSKVPSAQGDREAIRNHRSQKWFKLHKKWHFSSSLLSPAEKTISLAYKLRKHVGKPKNLGFL